MSTPFSELFANVILGIDTLWGGDVLSASGTGRAVADSYFADAPLPAAYLHPAAQALRHCGGVGPRLDAAALDDYLRAVQPRRLLDELALEARRLGGPRGAYLDGLVLCCEVMYELALEVAGQGPKVSYERCVRTLTGAAPRPSEPAGKRQEVVALLRDAGYPADEPELPDAVAQWRRDRLVPAAEIPARAAATIAQLEQLTERNVAPYLPAELRGVPRSNVQFLPIQDAWFSGSMNYLGRARRPDGRPEYEATYELNAALTISAPEFEQLVSHEVVPGHVTTFAYLQHLHHLGRVGFEATILTMNTRPAVLFEGIANNAVLLAHGVRAVADLPDPELRLGVLLALLQDDAKNQASYLTWRRGLSPAEVAAELRRDYLLTDERADKLSGAWGRHPLMGRMYLPAYRDGTERVAALLQRHPRELILPLLFGWGGLVDMSTVEALAASHAGSAPCSCAPTS